MAFTYTNSLNREYSTQPCNITSVEFDISQYGKYNRILSFMEPVSEKQAIEAVEIWMNKPLTEKYYNKIKDDLFDIEIVPWAKARKSLSCRGDCLSDCIFIEDTQVTNGCLTPSMGS